MKPPPIPTRPPMRADVKMTIVAAVLVGIECLYLARNGVWMGASDFGDIFMYPLILACWAALFGALYHVVRRVVREDRQVSWRTGVHGSAIIVIAAALCCSRGLLFVPTCSLLPAISTKRVFGNSLQPWAMSLLVQPESRIVDDPDLVARGLVPKKVRKELLLPRLRAEKVLDPEVRVAGPDYPSVESNERHIEVLYRTPNMGGIAVGGPHFRAWSSEDTRVLEVSRGVYLFELKNA